MIKFRCHQCSKKIGVPEDISGRRVWCPHCGAVTVVPRAQSGDNGLHAENEKTQYSVFICNAPEKPGASAPPTSAKAPVGLSLEVFG